jgi:hypothetical protein
MPAVAPCRRSWSSIWAARWGRLPTSACKSPQGSRQVLTKSAQDDDVRYAWELLSMSSRSFTLAAASDTRLRTALGTWLGTLLGAWVGATLGSCMGTSAGVHERANGAPEAETTPRLVPKRTPRLTCQMDPRGVPSKESRLILLNGDSRCAPRMVLGSTLRLVLGKDHHFPSAPRSVLGSEPRLVLGTPRLVFGTTSRLVPTGDYHLAPRLVLGSAPRLALQKGHPLTAGRIW